MPSVLDAVAVDDVFEASLSNGESDLMVVTETDHTANRPYITGYVASADPIRGGIEDAVFVPTNRSRLRVSGKKITAFLDHIVKARRYGTIGDFGEYDLDPTLPDSVTSKAKDTID